MIRTSEAIDEISEALVKAQSKFGAAVKDSQNPAYRSKYADLSSVIDATLEHLNAEGICVMQHPALAEQTVTVTTRLSYKGQWIESDLSIPAVQRDRFDAQSVGSAITYGCRYALQSILCVPREDDDGNAAAGVGSTKAAQKVAKEKLAAKGASVPALFFIHYPESNTYEITGSEELKKEHRELLKKFWNPIVGKLVCNDEQLEGLKYEFEQRKVEFRPLKGAK